MGTHAFTAQLGDVRAELSWENGVDRSTAGVGRGGWGSVKSFHPMGRRFISACYGLGGKFGLAGAFLGKEILLLRNDGGMV